ncbi:hypothetical protein PsorP6_006783 [Peronosclerospora sorghi]|uniref:Uncharacterized protein n=1 Tax=Peronosclerospora sorghi TaxID=230839 RepID=A0ACC0W463_9STRA|nr:hypothetical protein PsorP6_006783 [Peronosclerospora sorghi]
MDTGSHAWRPFVVLPTIEQPWSTIPATAPAMSTNIIVKGLSARQRRMAASSSLDTASPSPLWDFYACALLDDNDDGSGGEDTEDELETQDWILFQRQRAQVRLANACQCEARIMYATKH